MKKLLAVFLGSILVALAVNAQETRIYPSRTSLPFLDLAGGAIISFGGGDVTLTHSADKLTLAGGVLLVPDGLTTAPSIAFSAQSTSGWVRDGSGITLMYNGSNVYNAGTNGTQVFHPLRIGAPGTTNLVNLSRDAIATLQMGDDSATPVAQTFKGPDASSGNTAGGNLTVHGGTPSGTGKHGTLALNSSGGTVTAGFTYAPGSTGENNNLRVASAIYASGMQLASDYYANLGKYADSTSATNPWASVVWCSNCAVGATCATGGSGALAIKNFNAWTCK